MDASSPLAAMHPMAPPTWDRPSHGAFGSRNPFGSEQSILRDQFQRARPDYFNVKAIRGSSPSASLAADLSQNFCIDNEYRYEELNSVEDEDLALTWTISPRFPTPRRALFTSNMMGSMTNLDRGKFSV